MNQRINVMNFLYETHMHTSEASACSDTPGASYIEFMLSAGYSGMIITDHFFTGNTSVPEDLPWADRVEHYCSGYRHALTAAEGTGLQVFFGIEYNFECDEYLIYGVDPDWLLGNPDILSQSRKEVADTVHRAGGIFIQAHPYRERGYIETIHLSPSICDGAEILNAGNPPWQDALGYDYAKRYKLRPASGSDIHHLTQREMGGMVFPYRLETIHDFVNGFLRGDGTPVFCGDISAPGHVFSPAESFSERITLSKEPTLPVVLHS